MANIKVTVEDANNLTVNVDPPNQLAVTIDRGIAGSAGPAGVGVPSGGTTNQVLAKQSATNYDTVWQTTGSTLGGYPVVISDVQYRDVVMFGTSSWTNIPQIEISDGGNF